MKGLLFGAALLMCAAWVSEGLQSPFGAKREAECPEGMPIVQCLEDPCKISQCDVEGASCQGYYCGGCYAIWTDANNELLFQCIKLDK